MDKYKITGKLKRYMLTPLWLILLLIIIDIGISLVSFEAGILCSFGLVLYLILFGVSYSLHKGAILNEMVSFATAYGQVQKKLIMDFAVPYAVMDSNGRLLWFNNSFAALTGKDRKQYRKSLTGIFPEMTKDKFPGPEEEAEYSVRFGEKYFRLQMKYISLDELLELLPEAEESRQSESLFSVFLHDETELREYMQKYYDETMIPGLIYLDNYDEALESVEEVRRSLLTALIDRKINKYFGALDGLVKKLEKDKYFLVMRAGTLNELKEMRFSILEEVKKVNIGNEMSVTLSIGIGANNGSYTENAECARVAIDLALGRGGDQVVIKDGDSITYFGGKSQAVEKNTRVKARVKAHALQEFIVSKEKVVIMGHKLADIDCFGSAIGIYCAAKVLNKKAYIVIDNPTSSTKPFLDSFIRNPDYGEKMFIDRHDAKEMVNDDTLLVVLDTNKPNYTECPELLRLTNTIVVFDHHRQGNECIRNAVLSYIEPYASSTCEMVSEILQYFAEGFKMHNIEADAMYAGIMVDTNNFTQKTGVRTFEAAAFLRRSGADMTRVRKMFRENMNDYRAKGETLKNMELFREHYAISVCPSSYIKSPTIVSSQVANQLLDIIGVKASFVLTDYQNTIYISARAIDEVNVQIIMERMGGGGHLNMAGCQLEKKSMAEAISYLKDTIDEMLAAGEI